MAKKNGIVRGRTEDIISYFTLMSSEIHYFDIINVFRSVRLFEIFRSETSAEAPQDSEFLSFLGFNGRLLAEILSVLPRV